VWRKSRPDLFQTFHGADANEIRKQKRKERPPPTPWTAGYIHARTGHPERLGKYGPIASRLLHLTILEILATTVAFRIGSAMLPPRLATCVKT